MEIALTHLTRMAPGYICTAGIDLATMSHVRPVLSTGRIPQSELLVRGGCIDLGVVIALQSPIHVGRPPEVEDYQVHPLGIARLRDLSESEYWAVLQGIAKPRLSELFGPDLLIRGSNSCGVDMGKGTASLGTLRDALIHKVYTRQRTGKSPQVRIRFTDGSVDLDLGITDIRFYGSDHQTADLNVVDWVMQQVRAKRPVLLNVGLGHPPPSQPGGLPSIHWLQVNNVHLETKKIWRVRI